MVYFKYHAYYEVFMSSLKIDQSQLVPGMYRDGYFPNFLVDKVRDLLIAAAKRIEGEHPKTLEELYSITCWATEGINDLKKEFLENNSEIETAARDDIAISFKYIATTYGFKDAKTQELVATRDW